MPSMLYLPMTRMNLVAAVDAQILAPAGFFMKRRYYEDLTALIPDCIVATSLPSHQPGEEWVDDTEILNFPVIVEVELTKLSGIKIIERLEGVLKSKSCKAGDLETNVMCVVPFPIPVMAIQRVLCPGLETASALSSDPMLKDRDLGFEICSTDTGPMPLPINLFEPGLKLPKLKGYDLDLLEKGFSVLGGTAMLAEATRSQEWNTANRKAIQSLVSIDHIVSNAAGLMGSKTDLVEQRNFDVFQSAFSIGIDNEDPVIAMSELALVNMKSNAEESSFSSEPALNITDEMIDQARDQINGICHSILIRECIIGHPDRISAQDIIKNTMSKLDDLTSNVSSHFQDVVQRVSKGLGLVLEITNGLQSVDSLFNRKTAWATAIRAACIFVLRPEPGKAMRWPRDQRPGKATVSDYLSGLFLTGLYSGFTRLPRSVKDSWKEIVDLSLMQVAGSLKKNVRPVEECSWKFIKGGLNGHLSIDYSGKGSISFDSELSIKSLLTSFIDRNYQQIQENAVGEKEKLILISLARYFKLWNCIKAEYELGKVTREWEIEKIADELGRVDIDSIPDELLYLVTDSVGGPNLPADINRSESSIPVDDISLRGRIRSRIEKLQQNLHVDQGAAITTLHNTGISIARDLIRIMDSEGVLSAAQIKKVEQTLIYSLFDYEDVQIDSPYDYQRARTWIYLADFVQSDLGRSLKKQDEASPASDLLLMASELMEIATKLLGEEFVVVAKNNMRSGA
jgi:hypothetical protein